jgi:glycosyltransferase involved in cell wall biosynthesis
MKRKKICFVVSSPFTTGFLKNHIILLSKDFDVYLVANFENESPSMFNKLPLKKIKHIAIPREISLLKDLKALIALRDYFKVMKFDIVHSVTPKAGLLGVFASRLAGVKIRIHIFTGQVWHTKTGLFKAMLMWLDRFIVFNATNILVDGESQRQFLIQKNIVKDTKSYVLGKGSISGVDPDVFNPSEIIKREVREELGIRQDEIVYIFLGRLCIDKGVNELTEAFNKLNNKYKNARLLFVGWDEENMTPIIKEKAENIDSLIFYGVTLEPNRILQACDVFCLPSYREGFGMGVIEASLLEKPIICSDTYGLMETIIDNKTGLRHKVKDVESLYNQMERLVADQDLRVLLGKGGREYVLNNFSSQIISKKWLEFYNKICNV